jgi:hypothetical protein
VLPFSGPMEGVVPVIVVKRAMELTDDLKVPVVLEAHEISKLKVFKLGNHCID